MIKIVSTAEEWPDLLAYVTDPDIRAEMSARDLDMVFLDEDTHTAKLCSVEEWCEEFQRLLDR